MAGKTYGLKVNRIKQGEDDGTYTVRAVNSFGRCEASCQLNVTREFVKNLIQDSTLVIINVCSGIKVQNKGNILDGKS